MKFEEHLAESIEKFGVAMPELHQWLDEFAGKPGIGMKHRRYRHHLEGLNEVRRIFGQDAVAPARRHLISDLKMEGWKEGRDPFPENEKHYAEMGLY
jgi:hypothetical protein